MEEILTQGKWYFHTQFLWHYPFNTTDIRTHNIREGVDATILRASASVNAKNLSILQKKTCFFYFAHLFLQNSHISFSIIHIYSIKYLFFPLSSLSQTQHNPHSHHHPTTQQPSSSHTTTQPPSHSTKLPSMKFSYPFNQATINQPPKNQIQRSIINLPNHHHQATQQKSKDPITIIKPPSSTYPNPKIQKPIYQNPKTH